MTLVPIPTPATLKRYGLDVNDWRSLGESQNWACPICGRRPPEVRLVIDHEHRKGWRKMPPEERRRCVRGLVCLHDNHRLLGQFMTRERAQAVANYLEAYALRRVWGR